MIYWGIKPGIDYLENDTSNYLENDISSQYTTHTHQVNDVPERSNRTLVETGLFD
jgi:hypothetical protein